MIQNTYTGKNCKLTANELANSFKGKKYQVFKTKRFRRYKNKLN